MFAGKQQASAPGGEMHKSGTIRKAADNYKHKQETLIASDRY
jgi:hypothetical protein